MALEINKLSLKVLSPAELNAKLSLEIPLLGLEQRFYLYWNLCTELHTILRRCLELDIKPMVNSRVV